MVHRKHYLVSLLTAGKNAQDADTRVSGPQSWSLGLTPSSFRCYTLATWIWQVQEKTKRFHTSVSFWKVLQDDLRCLRLDKIYSLSCEPKELSRRYPNQMPKPPRLTLFDGELQQLCSFCSTFFAKGMVQKTIKNTPLTLHTHNKITATKTESFQQYSNCIFIGEMSPIWPTQNKTKSPDTQL